MLKNICNIISINKSKRGEQTIKQKKQAKVVIAL